MKIKAFTLASYAISGDGGNPAGVVLAADELSEKEMEEIAGIIGYSETAFVMKSDLADFKVRFFTPTEEVDICGHATIAAFQVLLNQNIIKPGNYSQETKAGIFSVQLDDDQTIMMEQSTPSFYEIIEKNEIADSLNISLKALVEDLPIQIVSTGLRDILVPVKNIDELNSIRPDFGKVAAICKKYNTIGYHVFTLQSLHNSSAYCRNFAPLYGIPEESATGTSNGALACYLYKYGCVGKDKLSCMIFEQGFSMGKPSEIISSINICNEEIVKVMVGGKAINLSEISIVI